jgi:hypothetical protein
MNELFLYQIIKAILVQSKVMQGRFIVAEGYGNDLNANNFNDLVKDALDNYKPINRKYPVSVLMPPVEIVDSYEDGWARFKLDQFFLCTTGYTGTSELKGINMSSNTATHPIQFDWKDMREVAGDFRKMFNKTIRNAGYQVKINSATNAKDYIRRVSNMGNDKLSGVVVSYELNIAMPCELNDYEPNVNITLPSITDIHPLHQH